jgi:hypothetical protein
MNASSVFSSGRGMPCGGIIPPRSFVSARSHSSACAGAWAALIPSNDTPPVLARSLWQEMQYFSTIAWSGIAATAATRGAGAAAGLEAA